MTTCIDKNIIYVTGLPRSGSTLLCQLLGTNPEIYSTGHSSPLSQTINQIRHNLSDNEFLLSQLDCDFNLAYQRLINAYRGLINGWFSETDKKWVVDKNRGWLGQLETINVLDPSCRMLVCIRDPAQIYGSIEAQHQKTSLLDFPDHIAHLSRHSRADKLFGNEGVIGAPLKAIESLQDIPDELQQKLYYVVFEHLMLEPEKVIRDIYRWLAVPDKTLDVNNLPVNAHESDSYYRFKYSHKTRPSVSPPEKHKISSRIEMDIHNNFSQFYQIFYPK